MVSAVMSQARASGLLPKDADPEILQDMIGGALMYHLLVRPGHRNSQEMRAYVRKVLQEIGLATVADRRKRPSPPG